MSVHIIFTTLRKNTPFLINNVRFSQEDVKHLGLHLDRRLTWHKHKFVKRKQLGLILTKMYWLLGRKSKLSTSNKLLILKTICALYKTILEPVWILEHDLDCQRRTPRTLPIKSFPHVSGRTLVRSEYGYPKGSPNSNS
jgi:hypothetical protein